MLTIKNILETTLKDFHGEDVNLPVRHALRALPILAQVVIDQQAEIETLKRKLDETATFVQNHVPTTKLVREMIDAKAEEIKATTK